MDAQSVSPMTILCMNYFNPSYSPITNSPLPRVLSTLDISFNRIKKIPDGCLDGMKHLKVCGRTRTNTPTQADTHHSRNGRHKPYTRSHATLFHFTSDIPSYHLIFHPRGDLGAVHRHQQVDLAVGSAKAQHAHGRPCIRPSICVSYSSSRSTDIQSYCTHVYIPLLYICLPYAFDKPDDPLQKLDAGSNKITVRHRLAVLESCDREGRVRPCM